MKSSSIVVERSAPSSSYLLVRILACCILGCGVAVAVAGGSFGLITLVLETVYARPGGSGPSELLYLIAFPIAASAPFFAAGLGLFWFKAWARKLALLLLTLGFVGLSSLADGFVDPRSIFFSGPTEVLGALFAVSTATFVLFNLPQVRMATGEQTARWWLGVPLPLVIVVAGIFYEYQWYARVIGL
ncbi:MAG TPA: hypothetical protein VKY31_15875 [Terriglobia bacterium]|nr:hypothetical protein [Terriglobia bacterium]